MATPSGTKKLNVAVLMGGESSEHEVSLKSGENIVRSLSRDNYDILPIKIEKDGDISALLAALTEKKIEVIFIALHGKHGEDGTIQGFLELLKIPYTGSGVLASALAMDKPKSMEIFELHGLPVPPFITFANEETSERREELAAYAKQVFGFPLVVKPADGGSSVGLSVVRQENELASAIQKALNVSSNLVLQAYILGREVTCGILDTDEEPIALPPTEIIPKQSGFFDYEAKYTKGATDEITPPNLPQHTIRKIQEAALVAHKALGCSGLSRTDMIVKGNNVYVLETNTIPGMTETSLFPQAAKAIGISFPELLDKLIQSALKKRK